MQARVFWQVGQFKGAVAWDGFFAHLIMYGEVILDQIFC